MPERPDPRIGRVRSAKLLIIPLILGILLGGCRAGPLAVERPPQVDPAQIPAGMSAEAAASLASLQQVDDYPLYTMTYWADYLIPEEVSGFKPTFRPRMDWACSLFAILGDPDEMLYGRNFDWDFSPALLLFTDPKDGYASVSMVDLYYLGFGSERAFGLTELPLEMLSMLLSAPYLPFDGVNEAGLAVGMAAVPDTGLAPDPDKPTVDSLMIIRMMLDRAATIEEAVEIIRENNIDWGSGPALHYLVADASGRSVLVEFSSGAVITLENQKPWQGATNFLVSKASADPAGHCGRYGVITERLESAGGKLSPREAMALLEDVSQENTQWSVVYRISAGEVWIAMGREYSAIHRFDAWTGR